MAESANDILLVHLAWLKVFFAAKYFNENVYLEANDNDISNIVLVWELKWSIAYVDRTLHT